jgi:hypothetical protein
VPVTLGAATPASPLYIDLCPSAPRSADQPFVGFDNVLLRLEVAFRQQRAVELTGLAGGGKSGLYAEFARWVVLTGGWREEHSGSAALPGPVPAVDKAAARIGDACAAVVIDAGACASMDEFLVPLRPRVRLWVQRRANAS